MKIKKLVQRPGPDTVLSYIDENSICINGDTFHFPPEAGPLSSYIPADPIIDAYRDDIGELHVLLTVRSSTLQPGAGEWKDFLPEEAYEDCIEL
jgi:hypothetical protein